MQKMRVLASNKEWQKWGETDPLFGVAAWPGKAKRDADPWTDEDFYKLGESDWNDFRKNWERYGVNDESCLEIGCGAGRITAQLATYFKKVHALDVSEKMIDYAKKHINSSSVTFHLSNGIDISLSDQSVNAVFSTHVFQHLDTLSIAKSYFSEISRVLKPNGTTMIHLPIYNWPTMSKTFDRLYTIHRGASQAKANIKRLLMNLNVTKPFMRWLRYPIDFFYAELPKLGFRNIEISIFITKSNNHPHPFIFAEKVP